MTKLDLGFGKDPVEFDPAGVPHIVQSNLPNGSYHVLINDTGNLNDPWIKLKEESSFSFSKKLYFRHDFPRGTTHVTLMALV